MFRDYCAALREYRRAGLSPAELLLLLFTQTLAKSDDLNCFHQRDLKVPSLERELANEGASIPKVIKRLKTLGFLEPVASGLLRCSNRANSVKHPFNRVRNEVKLRRGLANEVNKIGFVETLIHEVENRCAEEKR